MNLNIHSEYIAPDFSYNDNKCGYVFGQNCFGREIYGEKFGINGIQYVYGVLCRHTGVVSKPERKLAYEIYNVNSVNRNPFQKLHADSIEYSSLPLDGELYYVKFSKPVLVKDSFFVALNFLNYAHEPFTDTIAILSGDNGSRVDADLAVSKRNIYRPHHGTWQDVYATLNIKTHFALFPVVGNSPNQVNDNAPEQRNITLFSTYPNPATDRIVICYSLTSTDFLNLHLFDGGGRLVRNNELGKSVAGNNQLELDLSSLNSGNFFILITGNKTFASLSFMKN